MDDGRVGRLIRVLRQRRGWRQIDLARRAGLGQSVVSDLELGRLNGLSVGTIRRAVSAFGLSFDGAIGGLGANADRLVDERHAALMGACIRWLESHGWLTRAEVSYSEWGERGSIDLLAWHPRTRILLVIEIKTELASVEETLRKHDEKTRLSRAIVPSFGWKPVSIGRLLVFPEDRTQRRRVSAHAPVLNGAYPMRTRQVRAWSRLPSGPIAGLMFLPLTAPSRRMAGRGRRERVRLPSLAEHEHKDRPSMV